MKSFTGKSGKFYYKNPVDDGKYFFAVYSSREAYNDRTELPTYVERSVALQDYDYDNEAIGYCFTVFNGQEKKEEFKTTLVGELVNQVDGLTMGKDYLSKLRDQYGDGFKFSYAKCELCETAL